MSPFAPVPWSRFPMVAGHYPVQNTHSSLSQQSRLGAQQDGLQRTSPANTASATMTSQLAGAMLTYHPVAGPQSAGSEDGLQQQLIAGSTIRFQSQQKVNGLQSKCVTSLQHMDVSPFPHSQQQGLSGVWDQQSAALNFGVSTTNFDTTLK